MLFWILKLIQKKTKSVQTAHRVKEKDKGMYWPEGLTGWSIRATIEETFERSRQDGHQKGKH